MEVILNGKKIDATPGQTILELCQTQGVKIPTLCHSKDLIPFASCWVCIVEVKGNRGFVPSCSTKITDGMEIQTESEPVRTARKTALELLFSNHYADCFAPCRLACPSEVDAQGYIQLIRNGQYQAAVDLIRETNPFPVVCGLVCTAPCEKACRRNVVDEPVSIRALKRFACDNIIEKIKLSKKTSGTKKTDSKVAIIGGGPAGLTCAYFLTKFGVPVTIYESSPEPGGMLNYAIPEYRLPRDELYRDIKNILNYGAELKVNVTLGKDFTIPSLFQEGYSTLFLAMGTPLSQKLNVEGESSDRVYPGLVFLRTAAIGKIPELGKTVLVVGGGNTAIDAARTAKRVGKNKVIIIYRRTVEEMPAHPEEIAEAKNEGVEFVFLTAPNRIIAQPDKGLVGLECIKMSLGEPDKSGRRRPEPIPGSEFVIPAESIIVAIGQTVDWSVLDENSKIQLLDDRGRMLVDPQTQMTKNTDIYAGGDLVTGPLTAIAAIGAGRRAAFAIARKLGVPFPADTVFQRLIKSEFNVSRGENEKVKTEIYQLTERYLRKPVPMLDVNLRQEINRQVELGYTRATGLKEADRCMSCGCQAVYWCTFRSLGAEYNVNLHAYLGAMQTLPTDDKTHPLINWENNKCILCGRCVRVCNEVMGINAINFNYRGFRTLTGPPPGKRLTETTCTSCGQCVATCPTGTITEKRVQKSCGPWVTKSGTTICPYCSLGCVLNLEIYGTEVIKVSPREKNLTVHPYLCLKGKFGYEYVNDKDRLRYCIIPGKRGDTSNARPKFRRQRVDFTQAVKLVSSKLRNLRDKFGPDSIAVTVSPRLSNEELSLAYRFARESIRTKYITSWGTGTSYTQNFDLQGYDIINQAKTVLLLNSNVVVEHPVLAINLYRILQQGIDVYSVDTQEQKDKFQPVKYLLPLTNRFTVPEIIPILNRLILDIIKEDKITQTVNEPNLNEFCKFITEEQNVNNIYPEIRSLIPTIAKTRPLVVIVNQDNLTVNQKRAVENLRTLVKHTPGIYIIDLYTKNNTRGLVNLYTSLVEHEEIITASETGQIRGWYIIGEDPVGTIVDKQQKNRLINVINKLDTCILHDMFFTETAKYTDIIFPMLSHLEQAGSYTSSIGKTVSFIPQIQPYNVQFSLSELIPQIVGGAGLASLSNPESNLKIEGENTKYNFVSVKQDGKPGWVFANGADCIETRLVHFLTKNKLM